MNSLKFLAVNASLETGRDVVGRFQMREECLLPRFGAGNPEGTDRSAENSPQSRPSWWREFFQLFRRTRVEHAGGSEMKADSRVADGAPEEIQAVQPAAADSAGPPEETPITRREPELARGATTVQAEFRFENVRVVCNDLHDADFEIVSRPAGRRVNSGTPDADLLVGV